MIKILHVKIYENNLKYENDLSHKHLKLKKSILNIF